jgi:hypothetical protein
MRSTTSPDLVGRLSAHKPFTFVRLGDGDWYCALGGTGFDSNGVVLQKSHSMCEELKEDFKSYGSRNDANFFPVLGTFFLCRERSPDLFAHVEAFFSYEPMQSNFSGFVDSNTVGFYFPLLPPVEHGRRPGVLPLLVGQVVVLVGPKHLGKLHAMLNYTAHIEVPLHSCWEARDSILSAIKGQSKRHQSDTVVFLVAGGIATRTMLYQTFLSLGQKDTFIDVGASLDGFAGIASRDYNSNISAICADYPEYVADGLCVKYAKIVKVDTSAKEADIDSDDDDQNDSEDDGATTISHMAKTPPPAARSIHGTHTQHTIRNVIRSGGSPLESGEGVWWVALWNLLPFPLRSLADLLFGKFLPEPVGA